MGFHRFLLPCSVLFLMVLSTLTVPHVKAEWISLNQPLGAGAYSAAGGELRRFSEVLNPGFDAQDLTSPIPGDGLIGESSEGPDVDGFWRFPLHTSTSQYSFSESFTTSGVNVEWLIPVRPFFCGAAMQRLDLKNKITGEVHHPTIFRAGAGVGTKPRSELLMAAGAFISSMDLLDRQFTAIAFKSSVTWLQADGDAVLLSVVSPAAAFSQSGDEYGFHDLRLGIRYFHELYEGGPDFVVDAYYYENRALEGLRGRGFSAGLISRDGLWRVGYELAVTPRVGATHTLLMDFLVCFDFQNLFNGRNPFVRPPAPLAPGRNLERAPLIEGTPCGLLAAALSEMLLRLESE